MTKFVSGLQGPPESRPTMLEVLKKLEAGVKGYSKQPTAETKALEARKLADHEGPFDGWLPVASFEEMLDARLKRVKLTDTTHAEQLSLLPLLA